MRYVLDTHALVAFLADEHPRVGRRARRVLERAAAGAGEVSVSVLSLWEVAVLLERGRVRVAGGFAAWSAALRRAPGLVVEPLIVEDVEQARAFPSLVDPADRLIVGTALRLGATLLTGDERIARSGVVPVIW